MMKNKKLLIGILVVIILGVGSWWIWNTQFLIKAEQVIIVTDKTEYRPGRPGETVVLSVTNNLDKPIFLDACNPYFVQRNEGGEWRDYYAYIRMCERGWCGPSEIVDIHQTKTFEFPAYVVGLFRVKLDFGIGCTQVVTQTICKTICKNRKTIYSNEFTIK